MSDRTNRVVQLGILLMAIASAGVAQSQIFSDGFESGDTAAWFRALRPQGHAVTGSAANRGAFGFEVFSGSGRTGLQDNTPRREDLYMVDFFFSPNNWEMLFNRPVDVLQLIGKGRKGRHVRLQLRQLANNRFELRLLARGNTGQFQFIGSAEVRRNEWTSVSVVWGRDGTNGLDGGLAALYTNGTLRGQKTNLDNDRLTIDTLRVGLLRSPNVGRNGSFFLDDFQSFRTLAP